MTFIETKNIHRQVNKLKKYIDEIDGFVAGGVFKNIFNNEPFKDVDIFFETSEAFNSAVEHYTLHYDLRFKTDKVVCFEFQDGTLVELIGGSGMSFPHTDVKSTIDQFDFSITKMALYKIPVEKVEEEVTFSLEEGEEEDFEWGLIYDEMFFEHLFLKMLVIDNKIIKPFSTFERMLRYTKYGYSICRESKLSLVQKLVDATEMDESQLSASLYDGVD